MLNDRFELVPPHQPVPVRSASPAKDRSPSRPEARVATRNEPLLRSETSATLPLFGEVLGFLQQPLLAPGKLSCRIATERASVIPAAEEASEAALSSLDPDIPNEPWGKPWIKDRHGLNWSRASIHFLQLQLFWESLEEFALHNNEHEKWSVLKWIMAPAIIRQYVYDRRTGRSREDGFFRVSLMDPR